ncbi:hypothetical protein [Nocardioides speluncae]|uniref:hypothetical protein n=1 Tax=Nocardioides speluncae TaxID=2670337 RepID=UPI0012B1802C|nr:hypothetical protein [Nocardioides speluncae]
MRRTALLPAVIATVALLAAALPVSAAPTWLDDVTVTAEGRWAQAPAVAVDGQGNVAAIVGLSPVGAAAKPTAFRRNIRGSWRSAEPLGNPDSIFPPTLTADRLGNITAAWAAGTHDAATNTWTYSLQTIRRTARGPWGTAQTLGEPGVTPYDPMLGTDRAGRVYLVWWTGGDQGRVWFSRRTATGPWTAPIPISASVGALSSLDVTPSGRLVVGWTYSDGSSGTVGPTEGFFLRERSATGTWSPVLRRAVDQPGDIDLALAEDGALDMLTTQRNAAGDMSTLGSWYRPAGGVLGPMKPITSAASLGALKVVSDLRGGAVAAYEDGDVKTLARRKGATTWTTPQGVPVDQSVGSDLAVGAGGSVVLAFFGYETETGQGVYAVRRSSAGTWGSTRQIGDNHKWGFYGHRPSVAVDDEGNATVVWSEFYGEPASQYLRMHANTLDAAGPTTRLRGPVERFQRSLSVPVSWSATDRWSKVAKYAVRQRSVGWHPTSHYTALVGWKAATTVTSGRFAARQGRTYCFTARATDSVTNAGGWTSQRCTTTPLDDRALSAGAGWSRQRSAGHLLGTYTSASGNGASLTLKGVAAKRLALLVDKVPGGGRVLVSLGGRRLGTFSLAASARRSRVVVPVAQFAAIKTGVLTITVVSSGKPVRIDGVYLGR